VPGAVNAYFQKPGDGLGDNSLDGRLYEKKPSPLSHDEYVAKQNNKTALRFLLETPLYDDNELRSIRATTPYTSQVSLTCRWKPLQFPA